MPPLQRVDRRRRGPRLLDDDRIGADCGFVGGPKLVNIIHITHRDEVESPFVDWLQEAYELPDKLTTRGGARSKRLIAKIARGRASAKRLR